MLERKILSIGQALVACEEETAVGPQVSLNQFVCSCWLEASEIRVPKPSATSQNNVNPWLLQIISTITVKRVRAGGT